MILRRAIRPTEVKLSEDPQLQNGDNPPVQILRVGKFAHPQYGNFEITPKVLAEMVANFKANVRGVDIAFDYFHKSDELAAGWPKELILTEDGKELWAKMEWTPNARRMLAEREVRYFSPDFAFEWKDPESGVVYKNVLFGGGLTNRPFVKEMAAIVADEKGENMTELEKLQKTVAALEVKLAEYADKPAAPAAAAMPAAAAESGADNADEDSVPALKKKLAEMADKHAELSKAHEKLMAEMEESKKAKALAEKASAFQVLLSEGKAVPAQKDAFISGNMTEFVKLSQPLNLEGRGTIVSEGEVIDDAKLLKLAEERVAKNAGMQLGEAISQIRKELKK